MGMSYTLGVYIGIALALFEIWAFSSLKEWELFIPAVLLIIGTAGLSGYFALTFAYYRTKSLQIIISSTLAATIFGLITASLLIELVL